MVQSSIDNLKKISKWWLIAGFIVIVFISIFFFTNPLWAITLNITDNPDPVSPGGQLTYTISFTAGDEQIYAGMVRSYLDSQVDWVSGGSYNAAGHYVEWDGNIWLYPGETWEAELVVRVKSNAQGTLSNNVEVWDLEMSPTRPLITGTETTGILVRQPQLTLTKSDSPDPVQAGSSLTYSLTYSNQGNGNATSVTLVDNLPQEVDYLSSTPSGNYDEQTHSLTWDIGTLSPGEEETVTVNVLVHSPLASGTTITNSASITCYEGVSSEDSESTTVTGAPHLEISLSADKTLVKTCDIVTYRITYGNVGDQDATDVVIHLDIPPYATYVPGSGGDKAVLSNNGRTITWKLGSLKARTTNKILNFKLQINEVIPVGITELSTYATIQYKEIDSADSNEVTLRTVVPCLSIIKISNRREVELGDFLTYTIRVGNISLDDEITDLKITDILPRGFKYVEGSTRINGEEFSDPEKGEGGKRIWKIDSLSPGSTLDLAYETVVCAGAKIGENINSARVEGLISVPGEPAVSISAGPAVAIVKVVRGIFSDRGRIIGKVFIDSNQNGIQDKGEEGFGGITLILEDGTQVITDADGMFSIPALSPGDHLLSIDVATLPADIKVLSPKSQYVYVPAGATVKVNFTVVKKK